MHLQFCADGRDITGDFYAEQDATEVRAWEEDATLLGAVERTTDGWQASGSDVTNWTEVEATFGTYAEALAALGVDVATAE